MKNLLINSISLENFGKHKQLPETKFGKRTYIKGANKTGKSTIKRAIQFAFGIRDENGKEITGIRPHDKNGVDVEDVQTIVTLDTSVDGNSVEMKKVYHQNKDKNGKFTGNSTDCYVDDIPKKTKDYAEYVDGILLNEVCLNAMSFLNLDTTKRRKMLEDAFSEHTTDSIIDENSEFDPLRQMLTNATTTELKSKYRRNLKGDKTQDGLEKNLDDKMVEIRTVKGMYHDTDVAELELEKNTLNEQIAENKAKQEDVSKQFEEYQKLSDGIMQLKFAESDLQRKANDELLNKKKELQEQIDKKISSLTKIEHCIFENKREVERYEECIKSNTGERNRLAEQWKLVNAEVFDESTTICPTCHRELPSEEIESLRSAFEKSKADRLAKIEKDGTDAKQNIENAKDMISQTKDVDKMNHSNKEKYEKEVADLEKQLSELPTSIDISDTEEYKAIHEQITEKEHALSQMDNAQGMHSKLTAEYEELVQKLAEVQSEIDYNSNLDLKVEKLEKERLDIISNIGDNERMLDMVKRFENLKANLLESDVNKHFEYVQFRMFEKQVNGDLKDICSPVVDGESYDRNLNHGAKILTEIDICRAFQKKYDVCLPIIIDDCESLDPWRVPDVENQLILIMRSNDEELKIEVA